MKNNSNNSYDVIVVGAGISGLVCGCYLAKAGLKTLIVEKNASVGGCCTSFTSQGFVFDAFAHSLGGLRETGTLGIVLREIELNDQIIINKHDPSDIIVTPHYKISFSNDIKKIEMQLKDEFPKESLNITQLMKYFISSKDGNSLRLRNITFSSFLDDFIEDNKLKAILSMPVLGNTGLPSSKISAFTAVKLYQEFHIDGGYYPEGGMQIFSDRLAKRFSEYGGEILVSSKVDKILLDKESKIIGIKLKNERELFSKIIVSNADVTKTFNNLLDVSDSDRPNIKSLEKSLSFFSIYLGVNGNVNAISKDLKSTVWHMFNYDIEGMYKNVCEANFKTIEWFIIFSSPDSKGFVISILAPFKDKEYWTNNKEILYEKILASVRQRKPELANIEIIFKTIITPQIIENWTSNSEGAAYGWASTPDQCVVSGLTQNTVIDGLYLTGHWTTQTFGVSGVAYMGRDTAKMIIRRYKK